MPTPTVLTSGSSTTDTNSYATASVTPTAGRLVVVMFAVAGSGINSNDPSLSGNGLTWEFIGETHIGAFPDPSGYLFAAKAVSPSAGAITISLPFTAQACHWSVTQWAPADVSGTAANAFEQIIQNSGGSGTSSSVTLAAFASAANAAFGGIVLHNTGAISPASGETELHETTASSPSSRLQTQWFNGEDTSVAWSWVNSAASRSLAAEIKAPPGYISGTHTEQNFRQGPMCDSNGNLYVICEVPETDVDAPDMSMMKSTDGGGTWTRVDFANRPAQNDLESCVMVPSRTTTGLVHIVHQNSADDVYYHNFRTSDHATNPDTWGTKDESVHVNVTPSEFQFVDLAVKADDELCCVYMSDMVSTFSQVGFRTKPSGGSWSAQTRLDTTASAHFTWAGVCAGASDQLHFLYLDATNVHVYYRNLPDGGSLGARVQVDDNAPSTDDLTPIPPVYMSIAGEEVVWTAWERASNSFLVGAAVVNGTPAAEETISDRTVYEDPASIASQQTVAALAFDESTGELHVVYADASTHDLWHNVRQPGSWGTDQWGTDTELVDAVEVDAINVEIFERAGHTWLGIVYDDFLLQTPGLQRYTDVDLGASTQTHERSASLSASGSITAAGTYFSILERSASISATGSITVSGHKELSRSASLGATGTITTSGTSFSVLERSASLQATASIESSGVATKERSASLSASATIQAQGQRDLQRSVGLTASASIETTGHRDLQRQASLSATGSIQVEAEHIHVRSASLGATGTIQTAAQRELQRSASFEATASIEATGVREPAGINRSASLDAVASITTGHERELQRSASLGATASIGATGDTIGIHSRSASLIASTSIETTGQRELLRSASLEALGAIQAAHERDLLRSAALSALGTISVLGEVESWQPINRRETVAVNRRETAAVARRG